VPTEKHHKGKYCLVPRLIGAMLIGNGQDAHMSLCIGCSGQPGLGPTAVETASQLRFRV